MNTIKLTIDDKTVTARPGMNILDAAREAGIFIPSLCYLAGLEPYGGCRLCLVEVSGMKGPVTACTTLVAAGMSVKTGSPEVRELQRGVLDLILSEHPLTCPVCPSNNNCELQRIAGFLGVTGPTSLPATQPLTPPTTDPIIERDANLCVLCGRCVRTCSEIRDVAAITLVNRGRDSAVGQTPADGLQAAGCEFCGACVDICPTGAISFRQGKGQGQPDYSVITTCPYCGVGCQLALGVKDRRVIGSAPAPGAGNRPGQVCVKGHFGLTEFIHHRDRLTTPLIKKAGVFQEATWDEALELVARRFGSCAGTEIAVVASSKCTNEDNFIFQKFARVVLKTNNIDNCARLCHSPTISGLNTSFGSGAMTNSINEIGDAACILAIGTNTTAAHPVIALEIKKAVRNGAKLIVANPRAIGLCRFADIWLRHRPGTDVALMNGMMKVIIDEGLADAAFIAERCENYEAFRDSLAGLNLASVSRLCGVPEEQLVAAARLYAGHKPASILYAMGITQHSHGTDNVMAAANLAMLTGNIGKHGAGVNPLRGQNNVQGACDMGAIPDMLPGYQPVSDAAVRGRFETAWETELPAAAGLTLTEFFQRAGEGRLKALYVIGENPVLSEADSRHVRQALRRLDFLVVQDLFLSETASLADVVLPAASFAEKEGTFTSTERRVQRIRPAIEPVGDSRPDWRITCDLARKMGARGFDYAGPGAIMKEIAGLTPIYGGITYERLEKTGLQWPCPTRDHPGTETLHIDSFRRGKGHFVPVSYRPPAELPDAVFPLILTTERSPFHFHTGTLTRRIRDFNTLLGEGFVEINPADAGSLNIREKDRVRVVSRRGEVVARALINEANPPGVVSMNFHFAECPTNEVTSPALDPVAKIQELKVAAVRIEKI